MDHPEYHPGLWLAFGDLSGADNWRSKARVDHLRFLQTPEVGDQTVTFAVENSYRNNAGDEEVCRDRTRYSLRLTERGALLTWDTTFYGTRPFWFGDQEEMGLGLRVATALREEKTYAEPAAPGTGEILDNEGRRGAAEAWGKEANWLDYAGLVDQKPAGIAVFCHPRNFRPSRMHARGYGFVAANPFALAAFDAGEPSRVTVEPGESLRLRYGLLLHSGASLSREQLEQAYRDYCGWASH